ncbi:MAG: hypothetical protein H0U92_09325 [Actinobacteria bacterium]|nr:hypothetical protein [Actinomycetota bacterium]
MPEVENLMLANHAEAHDGLLYLMGAGWNDLRQMVVPGQPAPPFHIGIGLSILVGWNETNRRHHVVLYVEPEDGGDPLVQVEADLEVGRPAGAIEGSDQRTVLALNGIVTFPTPGGYRLVAQLGEDTRAVSFRVHQDTPPGVMRQSA